MKNISRWGFLSTCIALGGLQVLAFAPFEYWQLSFISLACYFFIIRNLSVKESFYSGLAFGYGLYGFGVSWVYVSLSNYGGMPLWMGSIAVLGFAGILALFVAVASSLAAMLFTASFRLIALPFIWIVFEWMKSWVLTGFPWLDVAYTQTPTWLFSWAPLGGVYLVSLVVALISALLAMASLALMSGQVKRSALLTLVVLGLVSGSAFLNQVRWSSAIGPTLQVGIVQANIAIDQKWQAEVREKVLSTYIEMSRQLLQQQHIDLLVWPETALPMYVQQTDSDFWRSITPNKTALLTGILDSPSIAQGNLDESYNAAVLSCQGDTQVYRKRHLVPFGEYLPLRFLFTWVLDYLQLPMSDFSSWPVSAVQSLECGAIKVGLSICYEDAFAAEYRSSIHQATMIVNISEDAWFGDSFAPHQRRQMAQMRARELSRPMVRSANSGPSLFIDENGKVLEASEQFVPAVLSRAVQPQTGDTPFKRYGNWIVLFAILFILGLVALQRRLVQK